MPTGITAGLPPPEGIGLYEATLGKKLLMAMTGIVMSGYVFAHLLGNLQLYAGPRQINAYAAFLHRTPVLLWGTRGLLLVSLAVHVVAGLQLWWLARTARPVAYRRYTPVQATLSSRTMLWSGVAIAVFVGFHVAHLTLGAVLPGFREADVFFNVVQGFRTRGISIFYLLAMLGLAMHLRHGLWSLWQTLGLNHPSYTPGFQRFGLVAAGLILAGEVSIPLAVMTGLVGR